MHILCPHCRNPIEIVKVDPREEIPCPCCGSSFRVETETTASWSLSDGHRLGKYQILQSVGSGAFGTVFKARDPELDRIVAVKIPRAGNLPEPKDLDRFLREARSAAQLRHPSIVTVHDVGQANNVPYLVSDFVEGITLTDLLTARRPSPQEAAKLLAGVADALHYAHEQGVVHRDVKPANIMIGPDGAPHIMDFGLAKREAGEITMTLDGQVLGTPAYMSPEQAKGEAHRVDGRSDVYSLGVILYQLLTGELPFRGNSRMLMHQVLHDEPRPPRSLNDRVARDLETICLKALTKEPAARYATARALADDLRHFLAGEPIQARPVSRAEHAWRWCRRNSALATSAVVAIVALIAVSVLSTVSARTHSALNEKLQENSLDLVKERDQVKTLNENLESERVNVKKLNELSQQALNTSFQFAGTLVADMASKSQGPAKERARYLRDFFLGRKLADNLAELGATLAKLARLEPANPRIAEGQQILALMSLALGQLKLEKGELRDAEGLLQQALEMHEKIVGKNPKNAAAKNELANAYYFLGAAYRDAGQAEKQEQAWLKSTAILESIRDEDPRYTANLGKNWFNLGVAAEKAGKPDLVIERQNKAIPILDKVMQKDPNDEGTAWFLCWAHVGRGMALRTKNDFPKALADLQRAVELAPRNDRDTIRLEGMALILADLGKHKEAANEAEAAVKAKVKDANTLVSAAKVFGWCAQAAKKDDAMEPKERGLLRVEYEKRALALISDAHKAGAFRTTAAVRDLRTNADFAYLQTLKDFQAFVMKLQGK